MCSCAPTIRGLELKSSWLTYLVRILLHVPCIIYLPFFRSLGIRTHAGGKTLDANCIIRSLFTSICFDISPKTNGEDFNYYIIPWTNLHMQCIHIYTCSAVQAVLFVCAKFLTTLDSFEDRNNIRCQDKPSEPLHTLVARVSLLSV